MKKRIFAILLSALLMVSATACNQVPDNTPQDTEEDTLDGENQNPEDTSGVVSFETYESAVSAFRKIVAWCPRYEEITYGEDVTFADDNDYSIFDQIFASALRLYPRDGDTIDWNCYERFGYTIKDLNGDGTDELIFRLDDHEVIAILTTVDEKPTLVDYYWNRKNCWIDPDGYLHVGGSNGADKSVFQIYTISDESGELILLEEGGTDGYDEAKGTTLYYRLVDGKKIYISETEYEEWKQSLPYAEFEATANISEYLPFVPLFDGDHPAPEPYVPPITG